MRINVNIIEHVKKCFLSYVRYFVGDLYQMPGMDLKIHSNAKRSVKEQIRLRKSPA